MTTSPLAPKQFPPCSEIAGISLAAAAGGFYPNGRSDLMLVELAPDTVIAGIFTQSLTAAAPIDWCRQILKGGYARAIIVNAGNANAFTGRAGDRAVQDTVQAVAAVLECPVNHVFVSSTGVIGEPLPVERIIGALPGLKKELSPTSWRAAAEAIMTTYTFPKGATRMTEIGDVTVTLSGFAKGSGMIAPDMATMLAYLFTDAKIAQPVLQRMLKDAADKSFNSITVDSDTSTSDSVLFCATGKAQNSEVSDIRDPRLKNFREALESMMIDLAKQIVRDGEGAKKFIEVTVTGAASKSAAKTIAMTVANSPLVKTAIAGEDANWGRIVMAVGKAGEKADRDALDIQIGGVLLTLDGLRRPDYDEKPVTEHMKGEEIEIAIDVGVGRGEATVWTCDLTHDYIDINADYRT